MLQRALHVLHLFVCTGQRRLTSRKLWDAFLLEGLRRSIHPTCAATTTSAEAFSAKMLYSVDRPRSCTDRNRQGFASAAAAKASGCREPEEPGTESLKSQCRAVNAAQPKPETLACSTWLKPSVRSAASQESQRAVELALNWSKPVLSWQNRPQTECWTG